MDDRTPASSPLKNRNQEENEPIFEMLCALPIFQGLETGELRTLAPYFKVMDLEAGDVLFREGNRGNYVCFLAKGVLDVLKRSGGGGDVVLTSLREGRSIGEMSIVDEFPRSATVKARTHATLVILTRDDFEQIASERRDLAFEILKGLTRLLSMNLRKTSARLADYMLPLS